MNPFAALQDRDLDNIPPANRRFYVSNCQYCNCAANIVSKFLDGLVVCLSALCSCACAYCCAQRRPPDRCGEAIPGAPPGLGACRCEHPECLGRWGGRQLFHPVNAGNLCILNKGHSGLCLCRAHAPTIFVDIQIYRPLLGPA